MDPKSTTTSAMQAGKEKNTSDVKQWVHQWALPGARDLYLELPHFYWNCTQATMKQKSKSTGALCREKHDARMQKKKMQAVDQSKHGQHDNRNGNA